MIDDTPYIIVDNHKIQPISRSPRPGSVAGKGEQKQERNFGVVDRVTISTEGREKSLQQVNEEDRQPLIENRPERLTHDNHRMLTYSPKGRR